MGCSDSLTGKVRAYWEERVRNGEQWTLPFLDLDVEAYGAFATGTRTDLGGKYTARYCAESPEGILFHRAHGAEVLCLASGGGQQSAQLSLLGARVTVLDLAEGQLARDREAAAHYRYTVKTVQGDMRDLSVFGDASFDHVLQSISMTFVPEVRDVYREVYRVLRPGGLYAVAHCNPATYPICFEGGNNGWDGSAYRISEPYVGGPVRITADGRENMSEGAPTGEHRHLYRDMFNGLIETGFAITRVWDSTSDELYEVVVEPGSLDHARGIEAYVSILAEKRAGRGRD